LMLLFAAAVAGAGVVQLSLPGEMSALSIVLRLHLRPFG